MPLRDEQILPPIIVIVQKSNSPTRVQKGHPPYPTHITIVSEAGIPAVVIKRVFLVGKIGNDKIRHAVVIVVLKVNSHSGVGPAIAVNRDLCSQTDLFKCAITLIAIEKLKHRVIGHHNVDLAVAIVVCDRNAKSLAGFIEAHFGCNFTKTPVALVMVDERGNRREDVRVTVGSIAFTVLSTPDIIEIPPQIA